MIPEKESRKIIFLSSRRIDREKNISMNSPVGITYNFAWIDGAQDIVEFAMGHIPAVKSFQPISFFFYFKRKKEEDGFELSMKEGAWQMNRIENGNRLYLVGRERNLPDGEDRRGRERLRSLAAWVRLGRAIRPTASRPEQNPKGSRKDYFRSFFFRWNRMRIKENSVSFMYRKKTTLNKLVSFILST